MKKVLKIDESGFFVEDVILKDNEIVPSDCIQIQCPNGFYKPKWTGIEWIEGATQEQIDAIKNIIKEPSQSDIVMIAIAELDAQREKDKLETQLAIAEAIGELTNALLGGE
ncbi:hypothetical protein [Clostridium sp. UBA1652]|uniref:hypothetical protein n=1 Tax=Clostridium sp. UBA1652 TaxID=1946348 RepID=UPI00257EE3D0|nr:hypothetical protein [Clostridium sp. UBA1652]